MMGIVGVVWVRGVYSAGVKEVAARVGHSDVQVTRWGCVIPG